MLAQPAHGCARGIPVVSSICAVCAWLCRRASDYQVRSYDPYVVAQTFMDGVNANGTEPPKFVNPAGNEWERRPLVLRACLPQSSCSSPWRALVQIWVGRWGAADFGWCPELGAHNAFAFVLLKWTLRRCARQWRPLVSTQLNLAVHCYSLQALACLVCPPRNKHASCSELCRGRVESGRHVWSKRGHCEDPCPSCTPMHTDGCMCARVHACCWGTLTSLARGLQCGCLLALTHGDLPVTHMPLLPGAQPVAWLAMGTQARCTPSVSSHTCVPVVQLAARLLLARLRATCLEATSARRAWP